MMYFIQQYHFRCYFISLYDVKSSFNDFTLIVAAILDFSAAILKTDQFDWLTRKIPKTHAYEHFYQVSCLYPDVHDCCHFPLHYICIEGSKSDLGIFGSTNRITRVTCYSCFCGFFRFHFEKNVSRRLKYETFPSGQRVKSIPRLHLPSDEFTMSVRCPNHLFRAVTAGRPCEDDKFWKIASP